MGGLTKTFETSQGEVTLARPTFDAMRDVAAKVLPLVSGATPVRVIESPEVKALLLGSVTSDTREALEAVFAQADYVEVFELWEGYCEHCAFRKYFILPLERERAKQLADQADQLAMQYAAMIKHQIVEKDAVVQMMQGTVSALSQSSMNDGEPTTDGAAGTSEPKTTG